MHAKYSQGHSTIRHGSCSRAQKCQKDVPLITWLASSSSTLSQTIQANHEFVRSHGQKGASTVRPFDRLRSSERVRAIRASGSSETQWIPAPGSQPLVLVGTAWDPLTLTSVTRHPRQGAMEAVTTKRRDKGCRPRIWRGARRRGRVAPKHHERAVEEG